METNVKSYRRACKSTKLNLMPMLYQTIQLKPKSTVETKRPVIVHNKKELN